jgi:hypothetical protein
MRRTALIGFVFLALTLGAWAQDVKSCKLPVDLGKLAAKAAEVVDVDMDSNMLQFAGNFMNKKKPDEAKAQKLISGLKGICVRNFEFDSDGQYSESDLADLRSQFRSPAWVRTVGVRSKRDKENVDVYFRMEKNAISGLVVIAAEPRELTFVHIDGAIDPAQLSELGGQFGIPAVEMPSKGTAKAESK